MNSPHFLLAADLLDGSYKIALKAKEFADKYSATLSILHVIELPTAAHYMQSLTNTDTLSLYVESAKAILMNLGNELGIPIDRQYVKDGNAAELTIQLAQTLNADTIIIGSHVKESIPPFLGTTASKILHKAKCDVYTIKLTLQGELRNE